jgi:hypothetical protein
MAGADDARRSDPGSGSVEAKAEAIHKVVRFVKWPASRFILAESPLVVGVWGDERMDKALALRMKDVVIEEHSVQVRACQSLSTAKACHVVYVGIAAGSLRASDLEQLMESGTLTVGSGPEFLERGGMIRLWWQDEKVRFKVNTKAVRRGRIEISSELLKLAARHGGRTGMEERSDD